MYVLQEEASQAGGNTCASIGEGGGVCMSWQVCVCVIVTGGVYFGSVHRLTANK